MRIIILLSIIMLGGLSQNGHAQDRVDDTPYDYYVRLTSNEYRPTQETGTKGTVSFSFPKHPELTTLFAQYGVSAFDFTFKHAVVEGLKRTYLMNVPVKEAEFQRLLESRYDHIFEFVTPMADYESFYEPDDYDIQSLDATWHLDLIGAKDAWDITTGDPNVFLGICELKGSGIDLQHPEVKDKIVRHLDYWPNNLSNVHGTAVAALAAGDTDNGEGTAAIGFNTRMVTLLGFNPILQLDSMIEMGVRVFNFSFGSYTGRQVDQEAMTDAYLRGAILIAGAGNDYPAPRAYPAAYDHVISVTSVGPQMNHEKTVGDPTSTHWHGPSIDLVAPGYDLVIPKGGYYGRGNGSSFAAP
ncbi:MAG: S8 family serine peptidase, partial [Bacteroidota bacterium]